MKSREYSSSATSMTKIHVKAMGSSSSTHSISSTMITSDSQSSLQSKPRLRPKRRPKNRFLNWPVFNIIRRLMVIAAAFQYMFISMIATWRTTQAMRGTHSPPETFRVLTASLIAGYVGDGLISDSRLAQVVLDGDTTPRDYALFLESETKTSTEECSEVPLFNEEIYNYNFLAHGYQDLVADTSYNTTALAELELVLVVVDCTFTQLHLADSSAIRTFNLVRSRKHPNDLYLVTVSLSAQDYKLRDHKKQGPALLGMLSVIHDMRENILEQFYVMALTYPFQRSPDFEIYEFVGISEECYLELKSIPRDPLTQPVKHLLTARKRGFYGHEDQFNVRNMYSLLQFTDAKSSFTRWEWIGEAVISDTWAWVHAIHLYFALQTTFSLVVLCLVAYQNFRSGKLWIGDPFAFVSTVSFVMRGILVLISWYVNSFWTLYEFALSNAAIISDTDIVRIHKELVHADVLVLYLGLVGLLSSIIRERIDPSVAIFLFEIIHKNRLTFIRVSPAVRNEVVSYSDNMFLIGYAEVSAAVDAMSPIDFWTTFRIPEKDGTFLAASFFPKISLLGTIACYAALRKVYRQFWSEQARQKLSQSNDHSANEKSAFTLKGSLTNFEISTGAELHTRFGLISDYKNYVFFKGMKFASADGVYCSGYVIVNGKFLAGTKDLLSIVTIKLVRARFTNVYVYEVDGNTMKDTARLVYPETFTWSDLWHLNVGVLL